MLLTNGSLLGSGWLFQSNVGVEERDEVGVEVARD